MGIRKIDHQRSTLHDSFFVNFYFFPLHMIKSGRNLARWNPLNEKNSNLMLVLSQFFL
jgi:hypothetical protein